MDKDTASITLFGIANCDTIKNARRWLDDNGIVHRFHDYRKDGIDAARLSRWCAALGWEKVINRAGTTYRALPAETRDDLDEPSAIAAMIAQPAMIKRPIVEYPDGLLIGFAPAAWAAALA